jgi:hypothetical protein
MRCGVERGGVLVSEETVGQLTRRQVAYRFVIRHKAYTRVQLLGSKLLHKTSII